MSTRQNRRARPRSLSVTSHPIACAADAASSRSRVAANKDPIAGFNAPCPSPHDGGGGPPIAPGRKRNGLVHVAPPALPIAAQSSRPIGPPEGLPDDVL